MELLEIILQGKLLYLFFQITRLVLININHVNIFQFFDEISSDHIIIPLIANLPGLLHDILFLIKLDISWFICKEFRYLLSIDISWFKHGM